MSVQLEDRLADAFDRVADQTSVDPVPPRRAAARRGSPRPFLSAAAVVMLVAGIVGVSLVIRDRPDSTMSEVNAPTPVSVSPTIGMLPRLVLRDDSLAVARVEDYLVAPDVPFTSVIYERIDGDDAGAEVVALTVTADPGWSSQGRDLTVETIPAASSCLPAGSGGVDDFSWNTYSDDGYERADTSMDGAIVVIEAWGSDLGGFSMTALTVVEAMETIDEQAWTAMRADAGELVGDPSEPAARWQRLFAPITDGAHSSDGAVIGLVRYPCVVSQQSPELSGRA